MIRALLLVTALVGNALMFAASWTDSSKVSDDKSADWWPCPESWCPWDES